MEECKDFIVRHFAFVGQVESYSQSFRLMTKLLGDEREPSHHVRRTVETTHNRLQMIPALVERICNLNSLDVELYDYFRGRIRLL